MRLYPYLSFSEATERKKMMLEDRKMRIMMRGVKVGKKKGGEKISVMKIFEKKLAWY